MLKISLSEAALSIPPYSSIFDMEDGIISIDVSINNFLWLAEDTLYFEAYLNSLKMAFWTTLISLLIGYPMAYFIAQAPKDKQPLLLLLILLPSWTSFLIRVYAWMGLLKDAGLINNSLLFLGVIDEPLQLINTNFAVYIGIVYSYLPFMVLPLYTNLVKHDHNLIEAATDLGASKPLSFLKITLPLSFNGIVARAMLVFIPVIGEYVLPELLGGSNTVMIGKVLWEEFFNNRDWPVASALAICMLLIFVIPISIFHHFQNKDISQ